MKILFDSQIFDSQKYGGISRYFSELFVNFNNKNIEYDLPIKYTGNEYLKKVYPFSEKDLSEKNNFIYNIFKNNNIINKIFLKIYNYVWFDSNKNIGKRALKSQNFDIFHPTYYSTYFLKYLKNKPFVLTVYDMIHEIYPEYFLRDRGKTIKQKKELILKADKIIAISENTKNDIINFYGISADKIKVIYLGNSLLCDNNLITNIPGIPKKYILYVGSRIAYKNFSYFIKSVSKLLNDDKSLSIIVAGGYSGKNLFSEEEKNNFINLGIEKQIFYYSVDDSNLAYLYKNALCFVFPTLYEGFGIPVLEAFSCDCPVVASKTSSLPEIGGDAIEYFNPLDSVSIINSVKKVVYNKNLRSDMILMGRSQLKKFSWEKTAKETMDVYLSIK